MTRPEGRRPEVRQPDILPLTANTVERLARIYSFESRWLMENNVDFIPGSPSHIRQQTARAKMELISMVLVDSGQGHLLREERTPDQPRPRS